MGIKDFIYTIVQQAVREVITKEVNTRIDSLSQRIDAVEKNLTEKFEIRFDNIEKELANIRGNLEGEARLFHIMDYWKKQQSM
jgi:archaellum component FlaC